MCGFCTHSAVVSHAEKTAAGLTTRPPRQAQVTMNDVISGPAHVPVTETLPPGGREENCNTNQHLKKHV